jgi:hypothetical protein
VLPWRSAPATGHRAHDSSVAEALVRSEVVQIAIAIVGKMRAFRALRVFRAISGQYRARSKAGLFGARVGECSAPRAAMSPGQPVWLLPADGEAGQATVHTAGPRS